MQLTNFWRLQFWKKLNPILKKLPGTVNGYRDGRYVIDNKFVLKIINKKIWEYNQRVHYLFIDFQKAYDSIYLRHALERYGRI